MNITSILKTKYLLLFALTAVTIAGFVLRLYKLDNPIADWHSWRQADTAAVTRNFIKDGFNPFFPQYDALNPLNEIGHNPNRYFFAEFPLYNIISYFIYLKFGVNEAYMRLVSAIFAGLTIPVLFLLVRKHSSSFVALTSAAFFAFLPYNIYYGRVTMADPLYIFFSVLTLYLVSKWVDKNNVLLAILSGIIFALAILTKPYALVLFIPILFLMYRRWKARIVTKWTIYLFGLLAIIPFLLWRHHINQYPEGMFGTAWLYNQGNIRFTGAYFRWLIFDRLNRLIFATGGFVLLWFGLVSSFSKKANYLYLFWLVGIISFFVIIARGNVTHDYYQLPIVPVGCVIMALGLDYLIRSDQKIISRVSGWIIASSLVVMMLAFGWYEVRGYYNVNHPEIVEAGKAVDAILPKDAIVIAPYDNDSAFLYQTNRHGYTYGGDKIEKYIAEGATHLVSVNFDDTTNYWMDKCSIVVRTETYVIVDLSVCKPDQPVFSRL